MSEVLIPFGSECLALSREQFEEARQRGREIIPPAPQSRVTSAPSEILDADGMETRTGIPATWWLEQARQGTVSHIRAGKYVRFNFFEALEALRSHRPTGRKTSAHGIRLARSGG